MFALVWPSAWNFASPDGSAIELSWIGSPLGVLPLRTPVPPICRTYIACVAYSGAAPFVASV